MKRITLIPLAVIGFTPLTSATAQMPVRPGARVRVTDRLMPPKTINVGGGPSRVSRLYVGTLLVWTGEMLVVESNGDTLAVPKDSVTKLEVSVGRKSRAVSGLLIGTAIGAIVGFASGTEEKQCGTISYDNSPDYFEYTRAYGARMGAILAGRHRPRCGSDLIGRPLGGSAARPTACELRPRRDGRFAVGASVRF